MKMRPHPAAQTTPLAYMFSKIRTIKLRENENIKKTWLLILVIQHPLSSRFSWFALYELLMKLRIVCPV